MKKITLLLTFASAIAFGQESYSEYANSNEQVYSENQSSTTEVIRVENGRLPILTTYTDRASFQVAYTIGCSTSTLSLEDFAGSPGGVSTCGAVISSAGDGCFAAGEIVDGFDVQSSNALDLVAITAGTIGNTIDLVGANTFAEFTILNFTTDTYAVGMDIWNNADPTTLFRVYGAGGTLIESYSLNNTVGATDFFGIIADEVITRIEIEEANGGGDLIGNLEFGDCVVLGVGENLLSQVSIFPNPTNNILNINIPSIIEVQSAVLYDVLGKDTGVRLENGTMMTSNLAKGIYILNLKTSAGTLTEKVIKN
ncbi:MAG: T9SS type A sorting domain-containing protein [Lutibacter sp.]|nr:T9SS type A sorting domain-containing protein [Lutibacter sp.]